jgi:Rad3-related DNA helicase
MVDERDVLGRIRELVEAEHQLRERVGRGELSSDDEHTQLTSLEQQLDQCWDLLRQRRARAAAGQDPGDARVRPVDEVEGYLS